MTLPILLGQSHFRSIREDGYYYVDKTALVSEVLRAPFAVLLLPRPRRFGKTLNLTMLQAFFDDQQRSASLFENLKVAKDPQAMARLNAHPTIFLTFKDLDQEDWARAELALKNRIAELVGAHYERVASVSKRHEVDFLDRILRREAHLADCERALLLLTQLLHRVSGRKVMVLIDEYDNPINEANRYGYLPSALSFLRNFLGSALKDNPSLERAVVTGILRIARESIYSGLNNLGVYSLLEEPFSATFGFTEREVQAILRDFNLTEREAEIRHWYNGYRFGRTTIYNPWSLMKKASAPDEPAQAFWVNTSGNELIRDLIRAGSGFALTDLQALMAGDSVHKKVDVAVPVRDLESESLWNLLLFSGYLTARAFDPTTMEAELMIPNHEVRTVFKDAILTWFGRADQRANLVEHLLALRMEAFAASLSEVVATLLSYHDTAGTHPERVYHAFVIGLLAQMEDRYRLHSNRESGHGRPDLVLVPRQAHELGFLFEFKSVSGAKTEDLKTAADAALKQAIDRDYAAMFRQEHVDQWIAIGFAFHGKRIALATMRQQLSDSTPQSINYYLEGPEVCA